MTKEVKGIIGLRNNVGIVVGHLGLVVGGDSW